MSGIDLTAVMDAIATAVDPVVTGTAYAWPVEAVVPGDAVVGYPPDPIALDATFQRGSDRTMLPVWVICGLAQDESTRDAVADLITGASSVVTALNGNLSGAVSDAWVSTVLVDRFDQQGGLPLVAVRFNLEVIS